MREYAPLSVVVYDRLKLMIENREFCEDKVYSETKLAPIFEMSRTSIREALIRLADDHYVDILPNRGFRIHRITDKDIAEDYHIRLSLETYSASQLISELTTPRSLETISEMRDCLRMQEALPAQLDYEQLMEFWRYDMQFHNTLVGYMDIPRFSRVFSGATHFFTTRIRDQYISAGRNVSTIDEHRAILNALYLGQKEECLAAIQRHLDVSREFSLKAIQNL